MIYTLNAYMLLPLAEVHVRACPFIACFPWPLVAEIRCMSSWLLVVVRIHGHLLCRALLADACRHYVALDSTCDVISFRRRCKLCSIFSICFYFSWRFLGKAICFYCRLARHARGVHSLPLVSLASGRLLYSVLHGQLVSHVRNFMLRC